jgi:uncharacterized protein (TIGR02996 family)
MPAVPNSHPDANAFIARLIAHPTDTVIRSVFADWLEDQGGTANVNWARYIRLRTEASALHGIDRDLMREDAANIAPHLKARLTIPATRLAPYFLEFLDLLPPDRLTVTLSNFHGPVHHIRTVSEKLTRELRALVMSERENQFAVATDEIRPAVALELGHLLQGGVVQFPTSTKDLNAALDRHFPTVQVVHDEEPEPEGPAKLEEMSAKQACQRLISEAHAEHAGGIELVAQPSHFDVRFLINGRPLRRYTVPSECGNWLVERFFALSRRSDSGVSAQPRNSSFGRGADVIFIGRPG